MVARLDKLRVLFGGRKKSRAGRGDFAIQMIEAYAIVCLVSQTKEIAGYGRYNTIQRGKP